jgi:hypothetical protein
MTFSSKEAREFFEAQQKEDEKISAIKKENQKQVDENSIMKVILTIQYSFPSYSLDYLLNQTLAQIQWLHNYAAGAVSYEVNAKAYAAGNMKKDAKLNFFIK